jgi:hypothetical protein
MGPGFESQRDHLTAEALREARSEGGLKKKKALQSRIRGAFSFFTGEFTGNPSSFENIHSQE